MDDTHTVTLMKLGDNGLTVADPERGKKVRFLDVESGEFLSHAD